MSDTWRAWPVFGSTTNAAGSLVPPRKNSHDDDRIAHHSRLLVVQTPAVRDVVTTGRRLAHLNRSAHYGRCGLIVSGPARTGKATAITQLGKTIEVFHRRRHPRSGDDIPVIYITVPPAATPKMIAAEFARFLGLPLTRRSNITDIIEAVCGVWTDTRTSVVCVDEIHDLNIATRAGAEASDTLKYFSERIPATFVFAGINVERLLVGEFRICLWVSSSPTLVPALPAASVGCTQRSTRPRRGRAGGPTAVLPSNSSGLEPDETARPVQNPLNHAGAYRCGAAVHLVRAVLRTVRRRRRFRRNREWPSPARQGPPLRRSGPRRRVTLS